MASLKIGDKIPQFSLPDQTGEMFDISSILGKNNLVIYFYPKDDTAGCTKEACSFRDHYEEFIDLVLKQFLNVLIFRFKFKILNINIIRISIIIFNYIIIIFWRTKINTF